MRKLSNNLLLSNFWTKKIIHNLKEKKKNQTKLLPNWISLLFLSILSLFEKKKRKIEFEQSNITKNMITKREKKTKKNPKPVNQMGET